MVDVGKLGVEADLAEPRSELRELCQALGAHLESLAASGAWGLPVEPAPVASDDRATPRGPRVSGPHRDRGPEEVPALASVSTGRDLTVIQREVERCERCGLHAERKQTVFARGTGSSGVAFVGEGPGREEDQQGQPFVGAAGQLLDRMIAAMKLERDAVYVCNVVKCRPPGNRKPEAEEIERCLPYLREQLTILRPRVIVALGATAVQALLGTTTGIMRLRGKWKLYQGKIPVMPTFHPAYLLRQPKAKRDVWEDLKQVLAQLDR